MTQEADEGWSLDEGGDGDGADSRQAV